MNWDKIEIKWEAMTRRVRADWTVARPEAIPKLAGLGLRGDLTTAALADSKVGFDLTRQIKTRTE